MAASNQDYTQLANYYANAADEFVQAYFVLGINEVRHNARYFVMAHCLELAFKASLANRTVPANYRTHDLAYLEKELTDQGDTCFDKYRPDEVAREVFCKMFQRDITNFEVQDHLDNSDALELLICYEHIADLKYGMDKDGNNLLAVTPSTNVMNRRFLGYISCARVHFPDRGQFGQRISQFVARVEASYPQYYAGASPFFP